MLKNIAAVAAIAAVLVSCGAPKVDVSTFQQLDKDKQVAKHNLPDFVLNKKHPKLIVLPPSYNDQYKTCNLSSKGQSAMMEAVMKNGSVEMVERAQVQKIMEEVKFQSGISGNVDATALAKLGGSVDYALVGSITSAQTGATYTPASYWTDDKGKSHKVNASCDEEGSVRVSYRLIEFPSGAVKTTFILKGSDSIDSGAGSCKVQDPCGRLGAAMESAVNSTEAKKEITSQFPLYGYIWKVMSDGSDRALYISLGTNDGIKPGDELDIINFDEDFDPITNTTETTPRIITTCEVSESNMNEHKSICLADASHADLAMVKHAVRVQPKLNWVEKLLN